jgi:hypothetical protein
MTTPMMIFFIFGSLEIGILRIESNHQLRLQSTVPFLYVNVNINYAKT